MLAGGLERQTRQLVEDRVELGEGIGPEGVARALGGGLLRFGPPAREPLWGRAVEQEGVAEQLFHRAVDVGLQVHHDPLQPRCITRLLLDPFQIVADRLFARDGGKRAEDRAEEADIAGAGAGERT